VLEVVSDHDGDTYRTVYMLTLPDAVYVLHAFQKKSRRGVATTRRDLELIRQRLRWAEALYRLRAMGGQP
jgi:phage-related protein